MLAMTGVMMMALAVIVLFPETRAALWLKRWAIEAPARALNRATVWRGLFYGGLIAAGLAMTLLFEAEGIFLYGLMAPEVLIWAAMFDVGLLIDAMLITAAILASNGLRVVRTQTASVIRRIVSGVRTRSAHARRPRLPSPRRPRRKVDDDGPEWTDQPAYRAFSMA